MSCEWHVLLYLGHTVYTWVFLMFDVSEHYCTWTALPWRWKHCDPSECQEILSDTASCRRRADSSPLVIHLISGRGCVREVRWRYQNYGSTSIVSHFKTQPVQSTMDGEQTCNLQKNQQSSAVRMSKRFMQRPKAILPASKGSLVSIFVCVYNGKVFLSSYWLELHRETKYCVKAYVNLICSYVSLMVCSVWGDTFWRFKELWSVRTMERGIRIEHAPSQ
jgi:hypothetical protein